MNEYSGYGEVEIGGRTLKFKFGLNAYQMLSAHRGVALGDVGQPLASDPIATLELAYFAHVTHARINRYEPLMSLTEFIEAAGDTDTMVLLARFSEIENSARFLGKTKADMLRDADDKKKVTP